MDIKKIFSEINKKDAEWFSLREVVAKTTSIAARDLKPEQNFTFRRSGVMVEVLFGGMFGYAASPDRSKHGIQNALDTAIGLAKEASKYKVFDFTQKERPPFKGEYKTKLKKPIDSLCAGEINNILCEITNKLKVSDKIIKTHADIRIFETTTNYLSSNGADFCQDITSSALAFSATAQEGNIIQTRTNGSHADCYQIGLELFDKENFWDDVKRVGNQAVELLGAMECPSESLDLVLDPDQMLIQIHESVGHPLELDRILGDERNYAGATFVRLKDFGKLQYGSKLMNITFDPDVLKENASFLVDDTGYQAKKEHIIKDGILVRALGGLESQARAGVPGVACTRSTCWNRPAIDRMANINLEPGSSSFDEIIASVKRGVYMEANRSWSIDDYRQKFQFGCEYAKLIENGKLTKTLKNPNYRGIANPFWRSLKMLGDKSTFKVYGSQFCGKGEPNQIIWVGHASPVCLFENVEVFGGAK